MEMDFQTRVLENLNLMSSLDVKIKIWFEIKATPPSLAPHEHCVVNLSVSINDFGVSQTLPHPTGPFHMRIWTQYQVLLHTCILHTGIQNPESMIFNTIRNISQSKDDLLLLGQFVYSLGFNQTKLLHWLKYETLDLDILYEWRQYQCTGTESVASACLQ